MIAGIRTLVQLRRARKLSDGFLSTPRARIDHVETRDVVRSSWGIIAWQRLIQKSAITDGQQKNIEAANVFAWTFCSIVAIVSGFVPILAAPLVVSLSSLVWIRSKIATRNRDFDRDYPTFLTTLSSTVRTGMDPRVAFTEAVRLFPTTSAMSIETRRMIDAWNAGEADEVAIAKFASSVSHPDVELLRAAIRLALAHGTSFSECLHRLARVTRARQSFRRKIRAALAMQRLSAIGIGLSALCIAALQAVTNRAGLMVTWENASGRVFLLLGMALVFVGIGWMTRIGLRAD